MSGKLDKAPRLSINIVICILSSDTETSDFMQKNFSSYAISNMMVQVQDQDQDQTVKEGVTNCCTIVVAKA